VLCELNSHPFAIIIYYSFRTIPKSILIGMPLIIVCYIAVNLSFFAVLTVSQLSNSNAIALVSIFMVIIKACILEMGHTLIHCVSQ